MAAARRLILVALAAGCTAAPPRPSRPAPSLPPAPITWACRAGAVQVRVVSTDPPEFVCDAPCDVVCGRLPLADR